MTVKFLQSFFAMKGANCEESNEEWMETRMRSDSGGGNDIDDVSGECAGGG